MGAQALTSGVTPMIYTPNLLRGIRWLTGESDLVLLTMERQPGTVELRVGWSTADSKYSTSFAIQDVSTRDGQDFVVHGVASNGDDVVEIWTLIPVVGSWSATRPAAGTPVGTPVVSGGVTMTVVGGTFVAPASRQAVPRVKRMELYRGQDLGGIRSVSVDPDRRFVYLLADGDDGLYRLDLLASGGAAPPLLVLDPAALPQLLTATSLYPRQHASEGRIYVVESVGGAAHWVDEISLLYDHDNDGILDAHVTMTHDQYEQLYGSEEVWADDFLNYD